MFERFSDGARRVVVLAQEEARMLPHNYIGTEHLLLALLREGGDASLAIQKRGCSLESARETVREIVGVGREATSSYLPFTPRAKLVLELGLREALDLNHTRIEPEHLLLGLLDQFEGVAIEILDRHEIDQAGLRHEVVMELMAPTESSQASKLDTLTIVLRDKEKVALHATNDESPEHDLVMARILEKRARELRKKIKAARA